MLTRQPGRNAPCWCGSGRKYKQCHLRLQRMPKVSMSEIARDHKALRSRKWCAHPAADRGECRGPIVASHTVPRHALLSIAERGHVY
jgi:hypothetical protein